MQQNTKAKLNNDHIHGRRNIATMNAHKSEYVTLKYFSIFNKNSKQALKTFSVRLVSACSPKLEYS